MTRLEELARKHFPLVAYDEALEFGRELIEDCARITAKVATESCDCGMCNQIRLSAEAIRALAEEGEG